MAKVLREATLYREDKSSPSTGVRTLTRGSTVRPPQTDLRKRKIDLIAGHFWVKNLPDITKWNEAYLEINAVATKGRIQIPNPEKLTVDVKDGTFSSDIQGAELITGIAVVGTGLELQIRLTEQDKIDRKKFELVKNFIDENDIPGIAETLLNTQSLPINPKETIKVMFNAVELIDGLNDDDRIWIERPKLDLRAESNNPLYEGSYALVTSPKKAGQRLPLRLYEAGGYLFESFTSDSKNVPFSSETYLTWKFLAS